MTQKAIWKIVVMVTSALIGIFGMQVYSILSAFQLNSELFDGNIHSALDHIVSKLEQTELEKTAALYNLPRLTSITKPNSRELATALEVNEISDYYLADSNRTVQYSAVDTLPKQEVEHLVDNFKTTETTRTWTKGKNKEAYMIHFERFFVHHGIVKDIPVQQRITIKSLDTLLQQELLDKGITTSCAYGVYSTKDDDFVMLNPVAKDCEERYLQPSDFKYSISLFPSSNEQVARLYVDFPGKRSFLWSGLWLHLMSTFIFTGIVIFCFYYTIKVILEQKKLSEMKNDFLNNMTHEFKTPIATISIATDTIKKWIDKGRAEKAMRFVNIIEEENKRMNSQVGKVLQMARIDKREFKLNLVEVYAEDVILNAAEKIALQVEQKGGQVILDLEASNSIIQADETHFTNIIHNLLDNANKYSPEQPVITIRTRNAGNGFLFEIEDNGLGISKEARKYIFDKFYRVPTGNLHDIKGFGLGLSYVQAIVTAHGGTIDLRSEVGKGSTFIVSMPFKQDV
ncbi:sensor histidine kinase [Aureispira anguillae]|uniref:histidine kinase n=1 Tax=Aureispira anguillae TaxID=2864201 RepID=A0A915YK21_9BACT|nr:HAMP domain-containing sensor histidine kinase [Aureispira anguillae]BDS14528.1 HAMP domain-containing histidine kinase [Aureispira anguillae]